MFVRSFFVSRGYTETAYALVDPTRQRCWLIDPGAQPEVFLQFLAEESLSLQGIWLTHAHYDHFAAVEGIVVKHPTDVWVHEKGLTVLENPFMNLSVWDSADGSAITLHGARAFDLTRALAEGMVSIIEAPGHSQDSVVFWWEAGEVAFVGDTLFKGRVGPTHFPGGDEKQQCLTIERLLAQLPGQTQLLSAHSEPTTVKDVRVWWQGNEKR